MNKSDILNLLKASPIPLTKREITQKLGVKGSEQRVMLKRYLREMERGSVLVKTEGGAFGLPAGLPHVTVLTISDIDVDGDVFAVPAEWNAELQGQPPRIEVMPSSKGHPAAAVRDKILARLSKTDDPNLYEARIIKYIGAEEIGRVMGVIKINARSHQATLVPAKKRAKFDFDVPQNALNGAKHNDLVVGEIQPSRGMKRKNVKIVEILGRRDDPKAISIISLNEMGLREDWPEAAIKDTKGLKVPPLGKREDLRDVPLVTIDGADARDFDDAVFAEKLEDGGFHLIVAIADVSYYVRTDTALDKEAQRRGNSTYFPDRVVPMLPEALSNDLCSLRPNEDRACLAMHMWIDDKGKMYKYKVVRGLMRSHRRMTYEQAQAIQDQGGDEITLPLYEAYAALDHARQNRGALDLDLPESQILIDDQGNMTGVQKRARLDSHKLIEEFMVLANVAAASCLEDKRNHKRFPCVYRVHDKPSMDKLDSARDFIESFDLSLPKGNVPTPKGLNHLLRKAATLPYSHLISMMVLRCQSQAIYHTHNVGHFGLALERYAHFTSPIRRYADLLVHRALVSAYGLGEGGIDQGEIARMSELCEHISTTERTSMEAERNATDRFVAAFLSTQVGAEFSGSITGVTRFGLFVRLDESGADGIIPMRSLADDFYIHDERAHALIGRRHKRVFRLGAQVMVRLKEADGLTGSTVLELLNPEKGADIPGMELKPKAHGDRPRGKNKFKGKPKSETRHRFTKNKGKPKKKR